jgi:hypothetical protein
MKNWEKKMNFQCLIVAPAAGVFHKEIFTATVITGDTGLRETIISEFLSVAINVYLAGPLFQFYQIF